MLLSLSSKIEVSSLHVHKVIVCLILQNCLLELSSRYDRRKSSALCGLRGLLDQHPMSWIANVHMAAVGEGCHEPGTLPSALGPRYAAFQLLCDQWSSREARLFTL